MSESTTELSKNQIPEFSDLASQEAWWTDRVHEWQASGSSQAAFSRARGIPLTTFNWWKRRVLKQAPGRKRLRRKSAGNSVEPQQDTTGSKRGRPAGRPAKATKTPFVPVRVVPGSSSSSSWWMEVSCRNGRVLRLRDAVELSELASLVAALES